MPLRGEAVRVGDAGLAGAGGSAANQTSIVCATPAQRDVGTVDVQVSFNGQEFSSNKFFFTYLDLSVHEFHKEQVGVFQQAPTFYEPGFYAPQYREFERVIDPAPHFYDHFYAFYNSQGYTQEAQFCIGALKPNHGPLAGGTNVTVKASGTIPYGQTDFFCVFGHVFVKAYETTYDAAEDAYLMACKSPMAYEKSTALIKVSLDGATTSVTGLPFFYHDNIPAAAALTPSTGSAAGGTSVQVTLGASLLPAGLSTTFLNPVCRFKVDEAEVDSAGTYSDTGAESFVTCVTPGFAINTHHRTAKVQVSLNALDFSAVQSFAYTRNLADRTDMFYGLGLVTEVGVGPELAPGLTTFVPVAPEPIPFTASSVSDLLCVLYGVHSFATVRDLTPVPVLTAADGSKSHVTRAMSPAKFDSFEHDYILTVEYPVKAFKFAGEAVDPYSNVYVQGVPMPRLAPSDPIPVALGFNTLQAVCVSADGRYANKYNFVVERLAGRTMTDIATLFLRGPSLTEFTLNTAFATATLSYTTTASWTEAATVEVGGTFGDAYSFARVYLSTDETVYEEFGPSRNQTAFVQVPVGTHDVKIKSFAQDEDTFKVYTVAVTRLAASSDKSLASLTLTSPDTALTPTYSSAVTSYTASMLYRHTSITVNTAATHAHAIMTVNGVSGTSHTISNIPLGDTVITVTVIAEDLSQQDYTVTITRNAPSSDATLASLASSACGSATQGILSPAFASATASYTTTVYFECTRSAEDAATGAQTLKLTPTCSEPLCDSIQVVDPVSGATSSIASGASIDVGLSGTAFSDTANTITLTVKAEDAALGSGTTKTYTVVATRSKKSQNADLTAMVVNGVASTTYPTSGVLRQTFGNKLLVFDPAHHEYDMEVEPGTSSLTVTATVQSQFAWLRIGTVTPMVRVVTANATASAAVALTAGATTRVRVEVLSQRYQPDNAVEGYDVSTVVGGAPDSATGARILNVIDVFRRTKSASADLSALAVESGSGVHTVVAGKAWEIAPTFAAATTAYTTTVPYMTDSIKVSVTAPDTASPVSSYNHAPRCVIKVNNQAVASGSKSNDVALTAGANVISVFVVSESGAVTKTYTLTVTREAPLADATLTSLGISCATAQTLVGPYGLTPVAAGAAQCWLAPDGTTGVDATGVPQTAAFASGTLAYNVRGLHTYTYHDAVVYTDVNQVTLTPAVSSFKTIGTGDTAVTTPVATIQINGQAVAHGAAHTVALEAAKTFPELSTTTITVKVTAEDGTTVNDYVLKVSRAPAEPVGAYWAQYYKVTGGPTPDTNVEAGTTHAFKLEVDAAKWNAAFESFSRMKDEFSAISSMVFQPKVMILHEGVYDVGPALTLAKGGLCSEGNTCIDGYCLPAAATPVAPSPPPPPAPPPDAAAPAPAPAPARRSLLSTPQISYGGALYPLQKCSKQVSFTTRPTKAGAHEFYVEAYGGLVGGATGVRLKNTYIYAPMSLEKSQVAYTATVMPGTHSMVITGFDAFGNRVTGVERAYSPTEFEMLICPPDLPDLAGTAPPPNYGQPGWEGYCRCGYLTQCALPGKAKIIRNGDGTYRLEYGVNLAGSNGLYMSGQYGGLPANGAPGSDRHQVFPLAVNVQGAVMGARTQMVPQTTTATVGGTVSFLVQAYDQFGNKVQTGGELEKLGVTVAPTPVDQDGGAQALTVTDEGGGMYKVAFLTVLAAGYQVGITVENQAVVGGAATFTVSAGAVSAESGAAFTLLPQAGSRSSLEIALRDQYRNLVAAGDYSANFTFSIDRMNIDGTSTRMEGSPAFAKDAARNVYLAQYNVPEDMKFTYKVKISVLAGAATIAITDPAGYRLKISNNVAAVERSEFYIERVQRAGAVVFGVVGNDQYGNYAPMGPFSGKGTGTSDAVAALPPTTGTLVEALYKKANGITVPLSNTVQLTQMVKVGEYNVELLYLDAVTVKLGSFPTPVTVIAAPVSTLSAVQRIQDVVPVAQVVTLAVTGADAYGNPSTVGGEADLIRPVINMEGQTLPLFNPKVNDVGLGNYTIEFAPGKSGKFVLHLIINGQTKTPSQRFESELRSSGANDFTLVASKTEASVGDKVEFIISPKPTVSVEKARQAVFDVELKKSTGELQTVTEEAAAAGVRRYSFQTTAAGKYTLLITLHNSVVGAPIDLTYSALKPTEAIVYNPGDTSFEANSTLSLSLRLVDVYGNNANINSGDDLVIAYQQQPAGSIISAALRQEDHKTPGGYADANFIASAVLPNAGTYSLDMKLFGAPLCINQLEVCTPVFTIVPGKAFAPMSVVRGSGLIDHKAGSAVSVKVIPLDRAGNEVLTEHSRKELNFTLTVDGGPGAGISKFLAYNEMDNSHGTTYTVTRAGTYTVRVVMAEPQWYAATGPGDYLVGGEAVTLKVGAGPPNAAKTQINRPTTAVVGETVSFSFTLVDDYDNVVEADVARQINPLVTGPKVKYDIRSGVALKRGSGPGVYEASLTTPIWGTYVANVLFENLASKNEVTFDISAAAPVAYATSAAGKGLASASAGTPGVFHIQGADRFGNPRTTEGGDYRVSLQIETSTMGGKTRIVDIEDVTVGWDAAVQQYRVEYRTEVSGNAYLRVDLDGAPIQGSPFKLVVQPGAAHTMSFLSGAALSGSIVNARTTFEIQARDRYANLLTTGGDSFTFAFSCYSSTICKDATVVSELGDRNDGTYEASYLTDMQGKYLLEVNLAGEPVGIPPAKSPLLVSVKENSGEIDYRKTFLEGAAVSLAIAGAQNTFTIVALDEDGIQMTAGGMDFLVRIGKQGEEPVSFSGDDIKPGFSLTDQMDGTYRVQYEVQDTGKYEMHIQDRTGQYYIKLPAGSVQWPIVIDCFPGEISYQQSVVRKAAVPSQISAGDVIEFTILPRDELGNAIPFTGILTDESFVVSGVSAALPKAAEGALVQDTKTGQYNVTLALATVGLYDVRVGLQTATELLPMESFPVKVVAGAGDASKSVARGAILSGGTVGRAVAGELLLKDSGSNDLTGLTPAAADCEAALTRTSGAEALVVPVACVPADGMYRLEYTSTVSGVYRLDIRYRGQHVFGSPFEDIPIAHDSPASGASYLAGKGAAEATAGQQTSFFIQATDQYNNNITVGGEVFKVTLEGKGQVITGIAAYVGQGLYEATYMVEQAGTYTLTVLLDSQFVGNQRYSVQVLPAQTSPTLSFIDFPDKVVAGERMEVAIYAIDIHGLPQLENSADKFEVTIDPQGPTFGTVESALAAAAEPGVYRTAFVAKSTDFTDEGLTRPYVVQVKLILADGNVHQVAGSPFTFSLYPNKISPLTSNVYGGDFSSEGQGEFDGVAGEPRKFLLQTRDAHSNDALFDPYNPVGAITTTLTYANGTVEAGAVTESRDLADGRFELSYMSTVASAYELRVFIDGQVLNDTPKPITIVPNANDFKKFSVYGPGVTTKPKVGETNFFVIEPRDAYGNFRMDGGLLVCETAVCPDEFLHLVVLVQSGIGSAAPAEVADIRYQPEESGPESQDKELPWRAGSYRGRFRVDTSGQLVTKLSVCPPGGLKCVHTPPTDPNFSNGAQRVGQSPYKSEAGSGSPSPQHFSLSGNGFNGVVYNATLGRSNPMFIKVQPRDSFGNTVELPASEKANFDVTANVDGDPSAVGLSEVAQDAKDATTFYFSFTVSKPGTAYFAIQYKDELVGKGQKALEIPIFAGYEPIDPALTVAEGPGIEGTVAGVETEYIVQLVSGPAAKDCQQTPDGLILTAVERQYKAGNVTKCSGLAYPFSKGANYLTTMVDFIPYTNIIDNDDGTYTVKVLFSQSGNHIVENKLGPDLESQWIGTGEVTIGDGVFMRVPTYSAETEKVLVLDAGGSALAEGTEAFSGMPFNFTLFPNDRFGNFQDHTFSPFDEFKVSLIHKTMGTVQTASITRNVNMASEIPYYQYFCSVTPAAMGDHSLQVAFRPEGSSDVFVPVSVPVTIKVTPGLPDFDKTEVLGLGVREANIHMPSIFRVRLLDSSGNPLGQGQAQAQALGLAEAEIVTSKLYGSAGNEVTETAVNVTYVAQDGEYEGRYTPTASGQFSLNIFVMGTQMPIKGYDFTQVFSGPVATAACSAEGPGIGDSGPIPAGSEAVIRVTARDANGYVNSRGGSSFSISVETVEAINAFGDVEPNGVALLTPERSVENSDGTYSYTYVPVIASTYQVSVTRLGEHVHKSPFLVEVRPGEADPNTTTLYCDDTAACALEPIEAGTQGFFFIQAKDQYGGNRTNYEDAFYYSVVAPTGFSKDAPAATRGKSFPGTYQGSFTINEKGAVDITVLLGNTLVTKVQTQILPGKVYAAKCDITSTDFPVAPVYSQGAPSRAIVVIARDRYGNQLLGGGLDVELSLAKSDGSFMAPLSTVDNLDGTYTALYTNKEPGQYEIRAAVGGENIPKVPFEFVAGPVTLAHTLVISGAGAVGELGEFSAGAASTFFVQFRDEWFNVRKEGSDLAAVDLVLRGPDGSDLATDVAYEAATGSYKVTFTTQRTGELALLVTHLGEGLVDVKTGKPFAARVTSIEPDSGKSEVFGAGVERTVAGVPTQYSLLMRDQYGNVLTGAAITDPLVQLVLVGKDGPSAEELALTSRSVAYVGDGLYALEYLPPSYSAEYTLEITTTLPGGQIAGKFVSVFLQSGTPSPAHSSLLSASKMVLQPGDTAFVGTAGAREKFYVRVQDEQSIPVTQSVPKTFLDVKVNPTVTSVSWRETAPGLFEVTVVAEQSGAYSLKVRGGGEPLGPSALGIEAGSLQFQIGAAFPSSARESQIQYPDASLTVELVAGLNYISKVFTYDTFGNRQSAAAPTDVIEGVLRPVAVDSDLAEAPCRTNILGEASYEVVCSAVEVGLYRLEVTLREGAKAQLPGRVTGDGKVINVVHSVFFPLNTFILPGADQLTTAVAGEDIALALQPRDIYNNFYKGGDLSFSLEIAGEDVTGRSIKLSPTGAYSVVFNPTVTGNYTVRIVDDMTLLPMGDTYAITVAPNAVALEKSLLSGQGLKGGMVEKTLGIVLKLFDTYGNQVAGQRPLLTFQASKVVMLDPSAPAAVAAVGEEDADGSVALSYTPALPGLYNLEIEWGGNTIPIASGPADITKKFPPRVTGAVFEQSLTSAVVTFDVATDRGGIYSDKDCATYFQAETVESLGVGAACVWQDDRSLRLFLGTGSTAKLNTILIFKMGIILNKVGNSHALSGTSFLGLPPILPQPAVTVTAPEQVGVCEDLHIDASASTGHGGRPMSYTLGFQSQSGKGAGLNAYLARAGASANGIWAIPATAMEPGDTYTFYVTATNWVEQADTRVLTVVKSRLPIPEILIKGGQKLEYARAQPLFVETSADLPNSQCVMTSAEEIGSVLKFSWRQVAGPKIQASDFQGAPSDFEMYSESLLKRNLFLPPESLYVSSEDYVFQVRCEVPSNPDLAATAEVVVAVQRPNVRVAIGGGNRSIMDGATLVLRAVGVDPDEIVDSAGQLVPFVYAWACATPEGAVCSDSPAFRKSLLTVGDSLNVTAMLAPGQYRFKVDAFKEPLSAGITASDAIELTIAEAKATVPVEVSAVPLAAEKFNPADRLTLELAKSPPDLATRWECVQGDLADGTLLEAASDTGTAGKYLSIPPETLTPGAKYLFRASSVAYPDIAAEVEVDVSAPPQLGTVTVTPLEGVSGTTRFSVLAEGWTGSAADSDLTYEFRYRSAQGGPEKVLSTRQIYNKVDGILPVGEFKIVAYVYDSTGAVARTELPDTVRAAEYVPPALRRRALQEVSAAAKDNAAFLNTLIANILDGFVNVGDSVAAAQFVDVYSSYLTPSDGKVIAGCNYESALSQPHSRVVQTLVATQRGVPITTSSISQTACAFSQITTNAAAFPDETAQQVYDLMGLQLEMVKQRRAVLNGASLDCILRLASDLIAQAYSNCDGDASGRNLTELVKLASDVAGLVARDNPPGLPPVTADTPMFEAAVSTFVGPFEVSLGAPGGTRFKARADGDVVASLINVHAPPALTDDLLASEMVFATTSADLALLQDIEVAIRGVDLQKVQGSALQPQIRYWANGGWNGNAKALPDPIDGDVARTALTAPVAGTADPKSLQLALYMATPPSPPPPPPSPPPPSPPPVLVYPSPPPPSKPVEVVKEDPIDWRWVGPAIGGGVLVLGIAFRLLRRKVVKVQQVQQRQRRLMSEEDTDIEDEDEDEEWNSSQVDPFGARFDPFQRR